MIKTLVEIFVTLQQEVSRLAVSVRSVNAIEKVKLI